MLFARISSSVAIQRMPHSAMIASVSLLTEPSEGHIPVGVKPKISRK